MLIGACHLMLWPLDGFRHIDCTARLTGTYDDVGAGGSIRCSPGLGGRCTCIGAYHCHRTLTMGPCRGPQDTCLERDMTAIPTVMPTMMPTTIPTRVPTLSPTLSPTQSPTPAPTLYPTPAPTPDPSSTASDANASSADDGSSSTVVVVVVAIAALLVAATVRQTSVQFWKAAAHAPLSATRVLCPVPHETKLHLVAEAVRDADRCMQSEWCGQFQFTRFSSAPPLSTSQGSPKTPKTMTVAARRQGSTTRCTPGLALSNPTRTVMLRPFWTMLRTARTAFALIGNPMCLIPHFRYASDDSPVQEHAAPNSTGYMDMPANQGQQSSGCKDLETPVTPNPHTCMTHAHLARPSPTRLR